MAAPTPGSPNSAARTSEQREGAVLVVLLRGINVGGRHKLPMPLLRETCESLGCTDVTTYIQSGNVVVRSAVNSRTLAARLESSLDAALGFTPRVVTRTAAELRSALAQNPFPDADERKLLIGFMTERPSAALVDALADFDASPEEFRIIGSEIYLHYVDGVGTSKRLAKLPLHKLGVEVTARNLRTVNKLLEMATQR